jgi:NAD(P)H-dependent FMN reductase
MTPLRLQVIVGSTRPNRQADTVLAWVGARADAHGGFEAEVVDLRDWPLPMFCEHYANMGDLSAPTYSEPVVGEWNALVAKADAYIIITPEYNHGIPGELKNAIDSVYLSFALRNKPVLGVGYSGGIAGGVRALEQLAVVALEAELIPLRNAVVLPFITDAFDEDGVPRNPVTETALQIGLDDLRWWADLLARGRAEGELPHGLLRMMAATRGG